jgi:hypothetical protein
VISRPRFAGDEPTEFSVTPLFSSWVLPAIRGSTCSGAERNDKNATTTSTRVSSDLSRNSRSAAPAVTAQRSMPVFFERTTAASVDASESSTPALSDSPPRDESVDEGAMIDADDEQRGQSSHSLKAQHQQQQQLQQFAQLAQRGRELMFWNTAVNRATQQNGLRKEASAERHIIGECARVCSCTLTCCLVIPGGLNGAASANAGTASAGMAAAAAAFSRFSTPDLLDNAQSTLHSPTLEQQQLQHAWLAAAESAPGDTFVHPSSSLPTGGSMLLHRRRAASVLTSSGGVLASSASSGGGVGNGGNGSGVRHLDARGAPRRHRSRDDDDDDDEQAGTGVSSIRRDRSNGSSESLEHERRRRRCESSAAAFEFDWSAHSNTAASSAFSSVYQSDASEQDAYVYSDVLRDPGDDDAGDDIDLHVHQHALTHSNQFAFHSTLSSDTMSATVDESQQHAFAVHSYEVTRAFSSHHNLICWWLCCLLRVIGRIDAAAKRSAATTGRVQCALLAAAAIAALGVQCASFVL